MTNQEKEIKKICKKLGVPIPPRIEIPSEEEIEKIFEKLYSSNYFDDACELIHTKEGFEKGYLTYLLLAASK